MVPNRPAVHWIGILGQIKSMYDSDQRFQQGLGILSTFETASDGNASFQ